MTMMTMTAMMAKESMSKISYIYLFGDIVVIVVSLLFGGYWLLNTQVAFVCSMLITFASFYGYKKSIQKGVKNSNGEEFKEPLDELLDPYNLYDDDNETDKQNSKKNSGVFKYTIKGFASGIGGAINPMRLFSYAILIASFMYLNRYGLFKPFAFFTGLSIVPIASMFSAVVTNSKSELK